MLDRAMQRSAKSLGSAIFNFHHPTSRHYTSQHRTSQHNTTQRPISATALHYTTRHNTTQNDTTFNFRHKAQTKTKNTTHENRNS
jgi:hypothetical protein